MLGSMGPDAGSEIASGLQVLSDAESTELLLRHHLGRIAFAHENWPVVLPVNYAFADPNLVVRTAPGAKLQSVPFHAVAFEVDDADPHGGWGWSVLVQGPAFDITEADDDRSRELRGSLGHPAAPGEHNHWLVISAVRLSGRYFGRHPLRGETPR